ncbi:hypothetical protein LCGC14_1118770 [marine sediment metagenome]|uniref:Uncharacterized protein n=1 Tax=marine sediment metagenome TaxID=412755 RepID=A0A0F9MSJ0_9ZZZZ
MDKEIKTDDKEFGKWIANISISNKLIVNQYERGCIIKENDKNIERKSYPLGTQAKVLARIINNYHQNGKK